MKRLIAELSLMREHVTPAQRRVLERAIKEIVELTDALHAYRVPAMRPRLDIRIDRSPIDDSNVKVRESIIRRTI